MSFRLQQLNVSYVHTNVSDIWHQSVTFLSNQYYHIRARSGQGKTTFIHTLYGIQKNFTGQLYFQDKPTVHLTHDEWCELRSKKISVVFQDLKLFTDKTALQNLLIKNELTNYYPLEMIHSFAEKLKITHVLNRNVQTLSFGERQRVAIIRALLQPFDCLLLDEPFSHLDNQNITLAAALILEEVQKRKATIICCDLEQDTHFPYHKHLNL
jgi:putative ABC transport system ATP-binding protein